MDSFLTQQVLNIAEYVNKKMNKPQKLISQKLQLNSSLCQDLSNNQQETIKGGAFDALPKVVFQTQGSLSRIDKSSPLIAKALSNNE